MAKRISGLNHGFDANVKGAYGKKAAQRWKDHQAKTGGDKAGAGDALGGTLGDNPLGGIFGGMSKGGKTVPVKQNDGALVQYAENANASVKELDQTMANDVFGFTQEMMADHDNDKSGTLNAEEFASYFDKEGNVNLPGAAGTPNPMEQMGPIMKILQDVLGGGGGGGFGDIFGGGNGMPDMGQSKTEEEPEMIDLDDIDLSDELTEELDEANEEDELNEIFNGGGKVKDSEDFEDHDTTGLDEIDFDDFEDVDNVSDDELSDGLTDEAPKKEDKKEEKAPGSLGDMFGGGGGGGIMDILGGMLGGGMNPQDMMGQAEKFAEAQKEQMVQKAFEVRDLNGDDQIDLVEMAATTLLTDEIQKFDGKLSAEERAKAKGLLFQVVANGQANSTQDRLETIIEDADLYAKEQAFKQ